MDFNLKNCILPAFSLLILCGSVISQPYQVGHMTMTFTDSSRNDRQIPVEVYYPALIAGEEVPVAPGQFPVLSFGHGFVMDVGSYSNFSDLLVPAGYIFLLSNTETGISPSHENFRLDLAFLVHVFRQEGADPGSLFFGSVSPENAVMGHSMGGGASMLAAAGDTIVRAVANFAAANTTPSAISAATAITVPVLLFSTSGDCVTPPSEHQVPMYDSLASDCKTLISITGGGHCYFANDNFLCTFGENSCGPEITITREPQQDATFDFLLPWLNYFLKGNQAAWVTLTDSLVSSDRISYQQDCEITGIWGEKTGSYALKIYPVPFKDYLRIDGTIREIYLRIFDFSGRLVFEGPVTSELPITINTYDLNAGMYQLLITGINGERIGLKVFKL